MTDPVRPPGKTTVAPEVLVTIVRLTVLGVPGVSRLATIPSDVERFFNKNTTEGIKVSVEGNVVYADVYVVLKPDHNVREVGHNIQAQVSRAISEMVGMEIGKVNIHVEDIDYASSKAEK
jgi:uncharacterized alkaline shock family protein YloU